MDDRVVAAMLSFRSSAQRAADTAIIQSQDLPRQQGKFRERKKSLQNLMSERKGDDGNEIGGW